MCYHIVLESFNYQMPQSVFQDFLYLLAGLSHNIKLFYT